MKKISEFIVKARWWIIGICAALLIPAVAGYVGTKTNYDILTYLPSDLETVEGQDILVQEFGMGAFSVAVVDNDIPAKEILALEDEIREVQGVNSVISLEDATGTTVPLDFLPSEIREAFISGDKQLMIITFNQSTSDEETTEAVKEIRRIVDGKIAVGGMSAMSVDLQSIFESETVTYVVVAALLCLVVLILSLDSFVVPFLLLLNIGVAVLYNMGSNIMFGEVSYITKAIAAVLQLGVTMDFSIFLYHSYEAAKEKEKDHKKAMAEAISETAASIFGSSLTTFAGFLALCTMSLTLGTDIGLVMAKGVLIGLILAVTLLPALILAFDKLIERTTHKVWIPKFEFVKRFVEKYHTAILVVFALLLIPAYYAQAHAPIYYKLDSSIPEEYEYSKVQKQLTEDFGMGSEMMILVPKDVSSASTSAMVSEIKALDGVSAVLSENMLNNYGFTADLLTDDLKSVFESENYTMMLVMSDYENATDELNAQVNDIQTIVKKYDEDILVAGEGPLMKDLVEVSDRDFQAVNITSIVVIFVLMIFVLRSISLPVILILTIEFAIFLNMGVPFITNTEIPFIASIVIGTIQLGATIDYAILITTNYLKRRKKGEDKKSAVFEALGDSVQSIFVSAMCFFAATIGVAIVSDIDMIGSLCMLIARGALISLVVVATVLPALLYLCDPLIKKTTLGFKKER